MHDDQLTGMADELAKIEKAAGIGSILKGVGKFFRGGAKGVGQLASQRGRAGLLRQAKDLPSRMRTAYEHGGIRGAGRALAGSRPVQVAGLAAVPFAAGRMSKWDN